MSASGKDNDKMTLQMRNIMRTTENLIKNNKKARYALYAVLFLAVTYSAFGLGTRFGEFAYVITH